MLDGLLIVIILAMGLVLVRVAFGPSWPDRVLAVNVFGTLAVLLLILIAMTTELYSLMDIALLYVLINFTLSIAILRFFKDTSLSELEGDNTNDYS